ncbi:MAG: RusA family crossover junction endodeoxyribonuclease [Hydrogenobaculum sp.]|jgi:crossover junction endodeoxyribonuclease RusA
MEDDTLYLFISEPPKGKANRYVRQKGGAVFKPWKVLSWETKASWEISLQLKKLKFKEPFSCKVSVEAIIFLPDKRRRDIDNMLKTLWDVLEKNDVIKNDNLIYEVNTIKHVEKGMQGIFIKIKPYEEQTMKIEEAKNFIRIADNNIIEKL